MATHNQFLFALRVVETRWPSSDGIGVSGDGGSAIGPLQIWRPYHQDAMDFLPAAERFPYVECNKWEPSRITATAYLRRYGRSPRWGGGDLWELKDWRILAKIHNGGPDGEGREPGLTDAYADKVLAALERIEAGEIPATDPPVSLSPERSRGDLIRRISETKVALRGLDSALGRLLERLEKR